jgi:hypothetical protein
MKPLLRLALCLVLLLPVVANAETTMTPMDDRGQPVVVKPWGSLTDRERLEQLRQLSTAHCFSYQRQEIRNGLPVCVENWR